MRIKLDYRDRQKIGKGPVKTVFNIQKKVKVYGVPGVGGGGVDFRILEDADFRITESGDFRILE